MKTVNNIISSIRNITAVIFMVHVGFSTLYAQNVGIDESSPASKLTVKGNLSVGSSYSTTAAPTSGAIIEGTTGIGTKTPVELLEVTNGNVMISNNNNTSGELRIMQPSGGANSFYTSFKAQTQDNNISYTLPSSQAASADVALVNDGTGKLTWGYAGNGFDATSIVNFEDFVFDAYAGSGSNDNQFSFTNATSGSSATSDVETVVTGNDYAGMHILGTGTSTSGRACLASGNYVNKIKLGGKQLICEMRVRIPTLSTGFQSFYTLFGLSDVLISLPGSLPSNGVYFYYTHSTNSGNWVGVTRNSGSQTSVNSSVAVAANTWTKLRLVVNAAGTQVDFYVNDVSIGSSNANITTNPIKFFFYIQKTGGSTSRTANIDYIAWRMIR